MKPRPTTAIAKLIQHVSGSSAPAPNDSNFDHYTKNLGFGSSAAAQLAEDSCSSLMPIGNELSTIQAATIAALEAICTELDKPEYEHCSAAASQFENALQSNLENIEPREFLWCYGEVTGRELHDFLYIDEKRTTWDVMGKEEHTFFQGLSKGDERIKYYDAAQEITDATMHIIDKEISRLGKHIYTSVPMADWLEAYEMDDDEDNRITLEQKLREILCC